MTYFSLRKQHPEPEPEPEPVEEEELDETEEQPDQEPEAAPAKPPNSWWGALWTGICGPGAWLTARFSTGTAWAVHAVAAWACLYYGGWVAAGIVLAWLLAIGLFTPREHLDRAAAWVEERTSGSPEPEAVEAPAASPQHALARWLLDTIGNQPGIHLRELYPAMRELPGQEGRTDAELRALLQAFGVPVKRSVRIGRIAGRSGVYRHHVEALLPSHGERPVETGGDAGQGADSPPLSGVGEGL
jgi:hypothetical protein